MAKFEKPKEKVLESVETTTEQVELTEKKTESVFSFLERAIGLTTKHSIKRIFEAMLVVVLVVFLGIFTFKPDIVFRAYDDYKTREHVSAMQERIDNTPLIQDELESFRTSIGASRAWVFELHNSTNSLDGMPFLFASMTYETVSPSLSTAAFEFDNIRLSLYKIVTYLRNNEYWFGDVEDLADIDRIAYQQFKIFNLSYGGLRMMKVEGTPNAILCFAYNEGSERPSDEKIMERWLLASYKINSLLTLSKKNK